MNKYLAVFLAVFGGCAIKWQIIGFFSPAWMIYKFRASYGDFDLRMGLWTSTACFYLHNEKTCKTVLTTDIEGKLALRGDPGSMKLLGDWIALQLLAVFAGAAALTGVIALVTYARPVNEKDLCHGGIVAGSWLLSGCLILTAVGLGASMNNNFIVQSETINNSGKGLSWDFRLPWAIVVSGIGGVFAAVAGMVMAIFLACKDRREAPGMLTQMAAGKPF